MLLGAPGAGAAPAALHAGHPLSGTLWDTRSGRQAGEQTLFAEAAAARWVLLGEKHDNAVHHALQARLVHPLRGAGRRFAVVLLGRASGAAGLCQSVSVWVVAVSLQQQIVDNNEIVR